MVSGDMAFCLGWGDAPQRGYLAQGLNTPRPPSRGYLRGVWRHKRADIDAQAVRMEDERTT